MARVVTVYNAWLRRFQPSDMSYIRWLKISEALARRGHQVDIATREPGWWLRRSPLQVSNNLRRVPIARIRWDDYDMVKTLFHVGYETLETYGGGEHPFIVSKLGSVVADRDMEGVFFHGTIRERLYATQEKIHRASRYVTVLSQPAQALWRSCFGGDHNVLLVPGGVDADIPPPSRDPFPKQRTGRCLFAGNVYTRRSQPEANRTLVSKLNALGRLLGDRGIRLYMLGSGDLRRLDRRYVTHLGSASYRDSWDYLYAADVGVVVSAGIHHNNESSKIYHYLRAGLPVVSEAGFPNDNVVGDARLGYVVDNGDLETMARRIEEALQTDWDRGFAVEHILQNHTWDKRVETYDTLLKKHFA